MLSTGGNGEMFFWVYSYVSDPKPRVIFESLGGPSSRGGPINPAFVILVISSLEMFTSILSEAPLFELLVGLFL